MIYSKEGDILSLEDIFKNYQDEKKRAKDLDRTIFSKQFDIPVEFISQWKSVIAGVNYIDNFFVQETSKGKIIYTIQEILLAEFVYPFAIKVQEYHNVVSKLRENAETKKTFSNLIANAHKEKRISNTLKTRIENQNLLPTENEYLEKALIDYNSWGGGKSLDREDSWVSPIYSVLGIIQSLSPIDSIVITLKNNPQLRKLAGGLLDKIITNNLQSVTIVDNTSFKGENLIYFGAPGTGKSFGIQDYIRNHGLRNYSDNIPNENVFRTTLHPEYTYSDFVGQIMPTVLTKKNINGDERENRIEYEFVPSIFTNALKKAVYNHDHKNNEPVFLILEEMSRSNVSAVFGDIFQLLDRRENGNSRYMVKNSQIASKVFGNNEKDKPIGLPANMFIIGTVNTGDQSVFPMDTAFKRRFRWKYISTKAPATFNNNPKIYIIIDKGQRKECSWQKFYMGLNNFIINQMNLNEDKQIGPYFINFRDKNDVKSVNAQLKDKLLQYLWSDIERASDSFTGSNESLFQQAIKSYSDLYSRFDHEKIYSDSFLDTLFSKKA